MIGFRDRSSVVDHHELKLCDILRVTFHVSVFASLVNRRDRSTPQLVVCWDVVVRHVAGYS